MAFDLFSAKGTPIERQGYSWSELAGPPISKLDDDAMTRTRIIVALALEHEAMGFERIAARCSQDLRVPLARVRRIEQQQAGLVASLLGPDHSPLELTIAHAQAAIECTAAAARREPDARIGLVYRDALLDDTDHLYRFAALLDRLEGKDANNILQCYTDIRPGRPSAVQHCAIEEMVLRPAHKGRAAPLSRLLGMVQIAMAQQFVRHLMAIGPQFADPVARQLYAEIAALKHQQVTRYESLLDDHETWLEEWMLHEAAECFVYQSCVEHESNARIKSLWEQLLDDELGHFHAGLELFRAHDRRDPAELVAQPLPMALEFGNQRDFIRDALGEAARLPGATTPAGVPDSEATLMWRERVHADGCPSESVAAGYVWSPGTELARLRIAA